MFPILPKSFRWLVLVIAIVIFLITFYALFTNALNAPDDPLDHPKPQPPQLRRQRHYEKLANRLRGCIISLIVLWAILGIITYALSGTTCAIIMLISCFLLTVVPVMAA